MAKLGSSYITALDIGTTKVACFIAKMEPDGQLNVIGIGHQVSQGIKSGIITDITKAETSIRAAVGAAEEMAGINVDRVIINISGNTLESFNVNAEMPVSNQEITAREIVKLVEQSCEEYRSEKREIIHCIPVGYTIDGTGGIKDPAGMYGDTLGAALHIITASATAIFNLANCLAHCHLDIEDYISSSYASGFSCLNEDEKELGVTLIDFGGGSTSIAVFRSGSLVFSGVIPLGGAHITNDIALGLSTSIESAERVKTLYGNVRSTPKDEQELIDIPQIDEGGVSETSHIPRATLVGIIRPRVEEILEMVKKRLEDSGALNVGGSIVITGGASQLGGLKEHIGQLFNRQVRLGISSMIEGMAESTKGPAFSTCSGILKFIVNKRINNKYDLGGRSLGLKNPLHKVIRWFKENF